jgi:hypothetical protein
VRDAQGEKRPIPRPPGVAPPCYRCPKAQGKGKPNPAAEMRGRNAVAYQTYLAGKAGLPISGDAVTAQLFATIQMVVDQAQRRAAKEGPLPDLLMLLLAGRR